VRLTFLGTGTSQGVPVIACRCKVCRSSDERDTRFRTSALLQIDTTNILFDIGPDFRQQMLRHRVDHLDAILITHAHRDHVGGLDDIRSFNYVQHSKMNLYLNAEAKTALLRDYKYIFDYHQYPGLPEAELHEVGESPFLAAGETVIPICAMHKDLPILGYRIHNFAYITDANYIAPSEMEKLKGIDVMVINALRKEKHFSHYSLPEALEVISQVKPREAYLTHISHEMGLHADVERELPAGVHLAYDNLTLNF
jgi:phosphoribosyl 1,2-cyclic phosphate phosphodiesterase